MMGPAKSRSCDSLEIIRALRRGRNPRGALGGAIARTPDAAMQTTVIDRCLFDGNTGDSAGAAYFHNSNLTITASTFTNNTGQRLHISNVRVSCGCTSASALQTDIDPGQTGVIQATMDTHRFVGLKTIETMKQAGATCLALDAGRCLIFDKPAVIAAENDAGICIVAEKNVSHISHRPA